MFTPRELALDRGWPGRIEGDWVVQLAAQTLEAFFTGGGKAREHNVYPLEDVALRPPILRPPSIRLFRDASTFEFGNTASIFGPEDEVHAPGSGGGALLRCRRRRRRGADRRPHARQRLARAVARAAEGRRLRHVRRPVDRDRPRARVRLRRRAGDRGAEHATPRRRPPRRSAFRVRRAEASVDGPRHAARAYVSSATSELKTGAVGGTPCERVILNAVHAPLSASGVCAPKYVFRPASPCAI